MWILLPLLVGWNSVLATVERQSGRHAPGLELHIASQAMAFHHVRTRALANADPSLQGPIGVPSSVFSASVSGIRSEILGQAGNKYLLTARSRGNLATSRYRAMIPILRRTVSTSRSRLRTSGTFVGAYSSIQGGGSMIGETTLPVSATGIDDGTIVIGSRLN